MKHILLLAFLALTVKSSFCQDSLRLLILQGDTVVALKPKQLKTLNQQIVLLSQYKLQCDKTISQADTVIANYKLNIADLSSIIANKDLELSNNQQEIKNLEQINKNTRKRLTKTTLYSSGGAAVIGLILGLVIAK